MSPSRPPKPTEAELAILRVLWDLGSGTVREVHDRLPDRGTGYTTTLKLLQIMTGKGLVRRDESKRSHVYRSAVSEEETQKSLVKDLLRAAFGGSASKLVMRALSAGKPSDDELAQIRQLLKDIDKDRR